MGLGSTSLITKELKSQLRTINLKNTKINQILFESKHFDGTFKEGEKLQAIKQKLTIEGYKLTQIDDENILAKKNYL